MSAAIYLSPLGEMLLAAEDGALTGIWFVGQAHFPLVPPDAGDGAEPLRRAEAWLRAYFGGERPSPGEIPIRLNGTAFQIAVWQELQEIPYGATASYGQIASRLRDAAGRPASARAVGNAMARNPVSILVPCHRVIGADGSLTGYAGGIERKKWLLAHEEGICLI